MGNLTSVAFLPKPTTQVQTGDGGSWPSDPGALPQSHRCGNTRAVPAEGQSMQLPPSPPDLPEAMTKDNKSLRKHASPAEPKEA